MQIAPDGQRYVANANVRCATTAGKAMGLRPIPAAPATPIRRKRNSRVPACKPSGTSGDPTETSVRAGHQTPSASAIIMKYFMQLTRTP